MIQTLGSGGVGKTTLSVVLGVASSRIGKKTLVITIDPSRRLMDTLHIRPDQEMNYVKGLGIYAMMMDVGNAWDRILRRYASGDVYNKIVRNRFNNYLRDYFPGFDEYVASEMIYYMLNVQDFDMIVVDSPPSLYAVSYLEASHRVIEALSNDLILSLIPYINIGSRPIKYVMKKEIFILNNLARFTGMEMLTELIKFVNDLSPLLQGFKNRADFIRRFYSSSHCGFFIVTLPNDISFHNTELLTEYLFRLNYNLDGILVNRLCSFCESCSLASGDNTMEYYLKDISDVKLKSLIERYFSGHIRAKREALKEIERFVHRHQKAGNVFVAPEMAGYIKSQDDILKVFEGIRTLVTR